MHDPTETAGPAVRRLFDRLLVAAFTLSLLLPLLDCWLRTDEQRGPGREMRLMAQAPPWPHSVSELVAWPRRYEAYWRDTFGLRDLLLRWHSIVKVFGFGVSPDSKHVLGEHDWIFNANERLIDSWRGVAPFDQQQLEQWTRRLQRRRAVVERLGGHYLFAVAPDKPAIYPEYVPARFTKVGPSRLDQLLQYVAQHTDVDVLDLRPALIAEKRADRAGDHVYFELGTHWQQRGAIAAFNAVVEHLRTRFPALRRADLAGYSRHAAPGAGDTEADKMYIGDLLPQREHRFVPVAPPRARVVKLVDVPHRRFTEVDDPALPRAVIFHDSFGDYFKNEWSETCSRAVMIWSYEFDEELLASEQPQLVIEVVVERALVFQPPDGIEAGSTASPARRFRDAAEVLTTVDPARPDATLTPAFGASMSPAADALGPYVEMKGSGTPDTFWIRGLPPLVRRTVLVRAEIEMFAAGEVALHWKTGADPAWSPARKIAAPVEQGINEVVLELPVGDSALEGLIFSPLPRGGLCRLRALAVRAATPGK